MKSVCSTFTKTWEASATCAGCGNHLYPNAGDPGCSCSRSKRARLIPEIVKTTVPSHRGSGVSKRKANGKGKGKLPSLPEPVPNVWVPTNDDLADIFGTVESPKIPASLLNLSWLPSPNEVLPHETELPPFVISGVQEPTEAELNDLAKSLGLSSAPVIQESLEDVVQSALDTSVASDDAEPIATLATELRTDADATFSLANIPVDEVVAVLMSI